MQAGKQSLDLSKPSCQCVYNISCSHLADVNNIACLVESVKKKIELFSVTDEKIDDRADLNERPDKRRTEIPNEISNSHQQDGREGCTHKPSRKHSDYEVIHVSPLSLMFVI